MKKWQSVSVITAVTLMAVFALCPLFTLRAQPRLTEAQAAALTPTPASLLPRVANFWSVSAPTNPPMPLDLYPNLPVYRLPDGSYLVDDSSISLAPPGQTISAPAAARSLLTQGSLANQQRLASPMLSDSMLPAPIGSTNFPPQNNPSPPHLIAPGSAPAHATYWFLAETNWPPMPLNPCPGCDVYALSDGSYLVDDRGYAWPPPSPIAAGGTGPYQPLYSSPDLWLEITGASKSLTSLVLHGSIPGTAYTILTRQTWSPSDPFDAEMPLTGAAGQDSTPFQVPTYGRQTLFFRAEVGTVAPTRLWLYPLGISNGCFNCILRGTSEATTYDLLSSTSIGGVNNSVSTWAVETNFPGAAGQYWTPVSVLMSGRPSLFLSARSWIDSTGSGIPDWWWQFYSLTNGLDPYALCPIGDGWTILQAYQNGWNPTNFYTPPTPTAWCYVTSGGDSRVIQWQADSGPVQGYELVKYHVFSGSWWEQESTQLVSAATFSLTDTSIQQPADDPDINPDGFRDEYLLYALYAGGESAPALVTDATTTLSARLLHGPGDQMQLALLSVPNGTTAIRLHLATNGACGYGGSVDHTIDIPVNAFTNNLYAFSEEEYPLYCSYAPTVQALIPSGIAGLPRVIETDCGKTVRYPFLDGSHVLKDNLVFTLQSQTAFPGGDLYPFYLANTEGVGLVYRPGCTVRGWPCPIPAYAAASYRPATSAWNYPAWERTPAPLHPWEINNSLRVFEHTPSASTCWTLTNDSPLFWTDNFALCGVVGGYYFDSVGFASNNVLTPCPSVLSSPSGRFVGVPMTWANGTYGWDDIDPNDPLIDQGGGACSISAVHPNAFGLPLIEAICRVYDTVGGWTYTPPYAPGASVPYDYNWTFFDCERFEAPALQKGDYQFTLGGDLASISPDAASTNGGRIAPCFLAASIGDPDLNVSAWLRYQLTNGTPGVYGYVEQYFDQAYKIDTSGNITTTPTGILSPYGCFFPTEPGPVALVTLPNIEDGQQGTGVVNVIKLQLDVNHDGVMDLTFGGPDNTSQARPFVFWANNDFDRYVLDSDGANYYDDSVLSGNCPFTPGMATPDCNYRDGGGNRVIPCERDLQDFTRLWVCGITTNLLAALPPGSTVSLSWGDGVNPNPANPTIDLFKAADWDGGIGYLTNSTIAGEQVDSLYSPYLGRLGPGSNLVLNASTFANNWAGNYFIWCGVSNGTGGLTMTIADGNGNTLAQTTAYIQIVDIKQMYERWTIGERPLVAPLTNALPAEEGLAQPFQYGPSADPNTPYILYVHGWNMQTWEKDRFAEAAFKRLYWQGYQGRFGSFRWPTAYGFTGTPLQLATTSQKDNFDSSEYTAWQSAAGLLNKLNDLNAEYPGNVYLLAHSMGNVVAGEALRLATQQRAGQLVNTYVASQAAISAHTYDGNTNDVPNYSFSYPPWSSSAATPNIYSNWFAANNGSGAGQVISFYNTNDYALQRSGWQLDQLLKPDQFVPLGGSTWNYGYNGSANDPAPWNHFYKQYPTGLSTTYFDIVNVLTNRYEVMALAAQSWTTALGATPNVGNVADIDLRQIWPPDTSTTDPGKQYTLHFWHSAEFRGDYWQQRNYWKSLLGRQGFDLQQ